MTEIRRLWQGDEIRIDEWMCRGNRGEQRRSPPVWLGFIERVGTPCAVIVGLALPGVSLAQESAALDWGPHGVGFKLIQARDSTRAFRPKRHVDGELVADETARPLQLGLWYPAATSSGDPRMTAGEFRLLEESELDFEAPSAAEAKQILEGYVTTAAEYGVEEARSRALLTDVTPAVRDAKPLAGTHPTILYVGAAWASDPLTAAYLASHGFVVAAFPNNGRMTATSIEFSPNALTLDSGIDDAGYAWWLMRREPLADTDRMGIYAFSATSLHALLWQMRDLQADAIVLVEGWERLQRGVDIVRENVQYDPLRVRVPLLLLERAADEDSPLYAKVGDVIDSLAYAERTRIAFTDAQHGDFLSHPMAPPSDTAPRVYPRALEIMRRFFEAQLEGDLEAARWMEALNDDPGITVQRSMPVAVAPSEEEIFRLAETDPQAAAVLVAELSNRVDRPLFREHVLARAAAFTVSPADRVVLWQVIARAYPASSNAWLRLGTSLAEAGRLEEAREALHAARTVVPDDPSLNPAEREERTQRIEERLRGLSGTGLP